MIQKVKPKSCCSDDNSSSSLYSHHHDERYYTEKEIDDKLRKIDEDISDTVSNINTKSLQDVVDVSNVIDKGIVIRNDRINSEIKNVVSNISEFKLSVNNGTNTLSNNEITISPQDVNNVKSSITLSTKYRKNDASINEAKLEFEVRDSSAIAKFNTSVKGKNAIEDDDFITKKQLMETVDYIVEHGENA